MTRATSASTKRVQNESTVYIEGQFPKRNIYLL